MIEVEKCYYINLEHRLDRKTHVERQIKKTSLAEKTYRYKAVEGAFVDATRINSDLLSTRGVRDLSSNICVAWGLSLTQGALGLIMTHLNIYSEIISTNKNLLIIEDDVSVVENFDEEFDKILSELPHDFDICYLGYCDSKFDKNYYSENLCIPSGQITCLPALIISPSGAAKLKSFIRDIDHQIDTFIYSNLYRMKAFASSKKLFKTDTVFDSDIQGNKNMEKKYKNLKSFEDIEIHSLMCHKDVSYGINCLKSLIRYEEFSGMQIIIHDDGSLTREDKEILCDISDRLSVIDREYADSHILNLIRDKPNCINYRIKESNINLWHKIKLFDYYYFSKTKKILGLDSDLLFLRRPEEAIKYISKGVGFYFPDNQSAYSFNEPKDEIETLEKVNTGLIYIPGENFYDLDSIENALSNLIRNATNYFPSWIEQSAFAHMFYKIGGFKCLDPKTHKIPYFQTVDHSTDECLHFVSYPPVREKYSEFIALSGLEQSEFVFDFDFYTKYQSKEIPVSLTFNKAKGYYLVEFKWGIGRVGIEALDHSFIVKKNSQEVEYKFQSGENGFFIIQDFEKVTEILHTYDWYGEKDWRKLDLNYE